MNTEDAFEGEKKPGVLLRVFRDQRVAFLLVGGINTVVGYLFFVAASATVGQWADDAWGDLIGSLVTLGVAHVVGTLWAYMLHRTLVFRVRGYFWLDLIRFESVYLVALGVNAVALPVLVVLGMNRLLAQALITAATTVLSYFGHRYFSFRRPREDSSTTS